MKISNVTKIKLNINLKNLLTNETGLFGKIIKYFEE